MRQALKPFRRIFTMTQSYHDSVVNGKVVDRRARDFSPRGVPQDKWQLTAPLAGKITKIVNVWWDVKQSYFEFEVYDGTIHRHVHCKPAKGLKVGSKFLKGQVIGDLIVYKFTHTHYSIRDGKGNPVWQDAWYKKHNLQPHEWWKKA